MYDVVVPCLITDSPTCIRLISLVNYVFHAISLIVYIILVFYVLLSKNILPKNYTKLNSLILDCDVQKVSLFIDYIYVKFWNIWEYLWVFRLFKMSLYKKSFIIKDEITVVQVSDMTHGPLFQWPRISPSSKLYYDYKIL